MWPQWLLRWLCRVSRVCPPAVSISRAARSIRAAARAPVFFRDYRKKARTVAGYTRERRWATTRATTLADHLPQFHPAKVCRNASTARACRALPTPRALALRRSLIILSPDLCPAASVSAALHSVPHSVHRRCAPPAIAMCASLGGRAVGVRPEVFAAPRRCSRMRRAWLGLGLANPNPDPNPDPDPNPNPNPSPNLVARLGEDELGGEGARHRGVAPQDEGRAHLVRARVRVS